MSGEPESSKLYEEARSAFHHAYAPYSNFHVGAAALTDKGEIVRGCNVENASYGLTICAERNAISRAIAQGERKFKALLVYTEQDKLVPPCGACRQFIAEFFAPEAVITARNHLGQKKHWTVAELLPDAFTPKFLEK